MILIFLQTTALRLCSHPDITENKQPKARQRLVRNPMHKHPLVANSWARDSAKRRTQRIPFAKQLCTNLSVSDWKQRDTYSWTGYPPQNVCIKTLIAASPKVSHFYDTFGSAVGEHCALLRMKNCQGTSMIKRCNPKKGQKHASPNEGRSWYDTRTARTKQKNAVKATLSGIFGIKF